ncbi:hypothetical protein BGW42_005277 [Actinomortierella wolfii]|nr:hypothetical protein BGW42_005277 [Actinomortierella wolfii]
MEETDYAKSIASLWCDSADWPRWFCTPVSSSSVPSSFSSAPSSQLGTSTETTILSWHPSSYGRVHDASSSPTAADSIVSGTGATTTRTVNNVCEASSMAALTSRTGTLLLKLSQLSQNVLILASSIWQQPPPMVVDEYGSMFGTAPPSSTLPSFPRPYLTFGGSNSGSSSGGGSGSSSSGSSSMNGGNGGNGGHIRQTNGMQWLSFMSRSKIMSFSSVCTSSNGISSSGSSSNSGSNSFPGASVYLSTSVFPSLFSSSSSWSPSLPPASVASTIHRPQAIPDHPLLAALSSNMWIRLFLLFILFIGAFVYCVTLIEQGEQQFDPRLPTQRRHDRTSSAGFVADVGNADTNAGSWANEGSTNTMRSPPSASGNAAAIPTVYDTTTTNNVPISRQKNDTKGGGRSWDAGHPADSFSVQGMKGLQ